MAGSPVIQPKAGAVKAPELSPYYSSIYIRGSLNACLLGFALSTRLPHNAFFLRYPGLVPFKIIMMLMFVGVLFINSY